MPFKLMNTDYPFPFKLSQTWQGSITIQKVICAHIPRSIKHLALTALSNQGWGNNLRSKPSIILVYSGGSDWTCCVRVYRNNTNILPPEEAFLWSCSSRYHVVFHLAFCIDYRRIASHKAQGTPSGWKRLGNVQVTLAPVGSVCFLEVNYLFMEIWLISWR